MEYLFAIPAFIALFLVIRRRADLALLWVYLPCLLFLPQSYYFHIPHLPTLTAAQAVLVPLGVIALFRWFRGPFRRMDLWVALYMVSIAVTEYFHEANHIDGILFIVTSIDAMFFSYLVGRTLIEPNLRLRTAKQIVIIVLLQLPMVLWQARMSTNLYQLAAEAIGLHDPWPIQFRSGHARVTVAFSDAELAGIAFAVCLMLNMWLVWLNRNDLENGRPPRLGERFSKFEKYWLPGWMLLAFLALTGSRGPILGFLAGFMVLQIARVKRRKKLAVASAAVFLLLGIFAAYSYFSSYASGPAKTEQQSSAAYRFKLLENYKPVLERGGWLGWGAIVHPTVGGQRSTDSEYLLVHISFGRFGILAFYLIVAESLWYQSRCVLRFRRKEDFQFAVVMLAALLVIWLTIATVYLGEQLPQLTFLLIGWGQALMQGRDSSPEDTPAMLMPEPQRMRVFS